MKLSFYGYLLILVFIAFFPRECEGQFFVVQMINAGARFPKEISDDWVKRVYDLTHIGMRQLYLLGREMSIRYTLDGNFLSERNLPAEVIIKAAHANDNLTISSAYAYSRGLYPPGTGQNLSPGNIIRAEPPYKGADFSEYKKEIGNAALPFYHDTVPIMVEGGGPDYLLSVTSHCPGMQKVISNNIDNESRLRDRRNSYLEKGKPAFKELSEIFKKEINTLEEAMKYRDYIISAMYYAKPMNKTLNEANSKILDEIYEFINYEEYYSDPLSYKMVLNGVLKEIKAALEEGIKKPEGRKKLLTYAVEDPNIFAMLKLLDKHNASVPFASLLEIKVVDTAGEKKVVRAYLNDKSLLWPDGKLDLSIEEFYKLIDANTLSDSKFLSLCQKGTEKIVDEDGLWMIIGFCLAPIMIAVVALTLIYAMRKPKKDENTSEPPTLIN